ncbi:pyridoxamine 5'-phosphate oxidase family protein [Ferrimonas balearica]|uniref:pyridoxamine 5'-phosphate oxidase family protein n=1 Tax=Ferrimonas balearica TaxID=44012 RepID=UPI001C575F3B|nr:pyridoxamine 5'-phosphate oxidase family protein [Ferrimonas balearica]MBW3164099.1 pyridoxamine 5'-phosphate oxidase family protein [Ferrimonas balearica]MBY5979099.1 pyridoxamine 5'-phosphate oxidase family protein [Ferrimonas balearica]
MSQDDKQQRLDSKLSEEVAEFKAERKTLQLATSDEQGDPHASYCPFAWTEQGIWVLVSDLAKHSANLKRQATASMMLLEDESESRHLFARRRLTMDAGVTLVERGTGDWQNGVDALRNRFGEMIDNLSALTDFHLFLLVPEEGRYVKGFGQAFVVYGAELNRFEWMREKGHGGNISEEDAA